MSAAESNGQNIMIDQDAAEFAGTNHANPAHAKIQTMRSAALDNMINKEVMSAADGRKIQKRKQSENWWTQRSEFQCVVCVFILGNAVVLGVEVDQDDDDWNLVFYALNNLFTFVFLAEMLCRWYVEGIRSYFSETASQLDFALVVMGIIDVWILEPISNASGLRLLTVIRIVRLLRLIRIIRIFRLFRELAVIGSSFAAGGRTLFFGAVFVLIVVYVFGIMAVKLFGQVTECDNGMTLRQLKPKKTLALDGGSSYTGSASNQCGDLYDFGTLGTQYTLFGSLDRAMLTLYTCVTDGCGQDIIYKMVYKTPSAIIYWSCFVFFTSIGLVNVMIGLFCENVFAQAAQNEKEVSSINRERRRICLDSLKILFKEMDTDRSSTISRAEFVDALETNTIVEKAFEDMELGEYWRLFDVLDVDGTGYLDIEEFFNGALLLANADEPAKAKDTIGTYLLVQAMSKNVYSACEMLKELAGRNSSSESSGIVATAPNGSLATEGQQAVSPDFLRSQLKMIHDSINGIGDRQMRLEQHLKKMAENVNSMNERQMRLEHEVMSRQPAMRQQSPRFLVRGLPSPIGEKDFVDI